MITRIARIRILFFAMAAFTLVASTPCEQALAALTQSEETDARAFRQRVSELLARQDVKEEFLRHGLDPSRELAKAAKISASELPPIKPMGKNLQLYSRAMRSNTLTCISHESCASRTVGLGSPPQGARSGLWSMAQASGREQ